MKIIPLMVLLLFVHLQLAFCPIDNRLPIFTSKPIIETPKVNNWEKEFNRWKIDIGFSESGNNWTICNSLGCMGLFQFKQETLENLGFTGITPEQFKISPNIFPVKLQEQALRKLIKTNTTNLKKFESYIGKTVNGVLITKSGLLAAAHLAGVGGVKSFLIQSKNPQDINGTTVACYLKKFQGYNI